MATPEDRLECIKAIVRDNVKKSSDVWSWESMLVSIAHLCYQVSKVPDPPNFTRTPIPPPTFQGTGDAAWDQFIRTFGPELRQQEGPYSRGKYDDPKKLSQLAKTVLDAVAAHEVDTR